MESGKYIVFKREDWDKFWLMNGPEAPESNSLFARRVPDAEVLRKQDFTVAPLLHAYSSIIYSFAELLRDVITEAQEKSLHEVADWAHNAALDAESLPNRKLPD